MFQLKLNIYTILREKYFDYLLKKSEKLGKIEG